MDKPEVLHRSRPRLTQVIFYPQKTRSCKRVQICGQKLVNNNYCFRTELKRLNLLVALSYSGRVLNAKPYRSQRLGDCSAMRAVQTFHLQEFAMLWLPANVSLGV